MVSAQVAPGRTAVGPLKTKRRSIRSALIIGLGAALALTLCAVAGSLVLPIRSVTVGRATTGPAVEGVYASGVVDYVRQARIASIVTAPVVVVQAQEGASVKQGDLLAQLQDGPQRATADQLSAQAQLAAANAQRSARLLEAGVVTVAANDEARSQATASQAAADSARSLLANYRIAAPFNGQVIRREAEPGDLALAGSVLFVIADPRSLRVTAQVDERDVGRLAVNMAAQVSADGLPGQVFPSRITDITPLGDANGRVFRVRLSLPPSTGLKPGMTVEANLITQLRPHAQLVPTTAVANGEVWIVQHGRTHRIAVKVGAQDPSRTEILSPDLGNNDLVLNPPKALKDGDRGRIRER